VKAQSRLTLIVLTLFFLVLSGCATRGDIDALRAEINQLQASTEQALKNSQDAQRIAGNTQADIADVRALAEAANARAEQNDEKMNKMFNRSVTK